MGAYKEFFFSREKTVTFSFFLSFFLSLLGHLKATKNGRGGFHEISILCAGFLVKFDLRWLGLFIN